MGFDLVLAHTSFLGHTGYAHHSRSFFTELNKNIPVRVRNFAHVSDIHYLTEEQRKMIIHQTWSDYPYEVGTPYNENPDHKIVNIVLNETRHYYFYDRYSNGPKIAYNVWESTRQPDEFFEKLLEFDQLWVPTKWQRDCSIAQGFPAARVKIVPEGIDTEKFCPGKSINPYPNNDRFRFIIFGRWDRRKCTTEIIRAFLDEFKESDPVDLYIHVDNPFGKRMDGMSSTEERLAYHNLNNNKIKILRDLEKVENDDLYISYLRHAHCFISCARAEGWNIPLLHAIATGTPTISSNYGAQLDFAGETSHLINIKEHIPAGLMFIQGDNVSGTMAEPDFEHLKHTMRDIYNNHESYKKKALIGSDKIRKEFTWENAVKKANICLDELYDQKKKLIKVNLGCGDYKKSGYINVDNYTAADMQMDMLNLTFEDNSIDEIYTSQTLEHFSRFEVPKVLSECYRVLKVGGVLDIEVPDLEYCIRKWLEADEANRWDFRIATIFGLQDHEGEFHKTGFTKDRLEVLLNNAGFYVDDIKDIWSHDQNCFITKAYKKSEPYTDKKVDLKIKYNFLDGVFIDILGKGRQEFKIDFINRDNNKVVYGIRLRPNHWARPDPKYFMNWKIQVKDSKDKILFDQDLNLKGQRVFINVDSSAMGDTLAWLPYVEEFRKVHECEVIASTFWNKLFKNNYPDIHFVEPGEVVHNLYAQYKVGSYDNDYSRNKTHWRILPLQKVASDILGLEYKEIKPLIDNDKNSKPVIDGDYVVISQHSTFQAKFWMYPKGWQMIVDYLNGLGYKVVVVSLQSPIDVINIIDKTGKSQTIFDTINIIKHSKMFIGISSGPSWLAWALNIPTIMISGYSAEWAEMQDCIRLLDKTKCHGCFNDISQPLDRGDWNWCPRKKNFECSTSITPNMVMEAINKIKSK